MSLTFLNFSVKLIADIKIGDFYLFFFVFLMVCCWKIAIKIEAGLSLISATRVR